MVGPLLLGIVDLVRREEGGREGGRERGREGEREREEGGTSLDLTYPRRTLY